MKNPPRHEARARAELDNAPTRAGAAAFRAKVTLLQLRRHAEDATTGRAPRHRRGSALASAPVLAESRSPLWAEGNAAERELQAGKVQNLRVALRRLDGLEVAAGAIFSFWRQVGRTTARKGYARGRELREGCLVPNVGGGLCQLSNALYDAALGAGCEIVERHAHTRVVPGSLAEAGRDATVFWNYVDLRWRAGAPLRLECFLTGDELVVRLRGGRAARPAFVPSLVNIGRAGGGGRESDGAQTGSCASCGVEECFRVLRTVPAAEGFGRAAFLVDEFWPEFDEYVSARRTGKDVLLLPLDGGRFGKANYAWRAEGFGRVRESRAATLRRAWASRRLAAQGAARQRALLTHAERLADSYARRLTYDVTHLTVAQPLVPFLWRGGHLGGRTFDVLMTRLPLARLHETLDAARALHPDSRTLGDFRAEDWLVRAEEDALARARKVITPHARVAALFPGRAVPLDWHLPRAAAATLPGRDEARRVVFPAATVARKGVYELRSAARELGLRLTLTGAQLEGPDFWRGVEVERAAGGDWLEGACAVVLPSFVEHAPRRLLEAVARGVPVVASTACGLEGVPGVVSVPAGDARALRGALSRILESVDDGAVARAADAPVGAEPAAARLA